MTQSLNYYWRLFATGLSFTVFGVGGLLLWGGVFPILNCIPGCLLQKQQRARLSVHYSFYLFIGLMHKLGIMTYEIKGLEKLGRPGQLLIANHPTLIDIVFLISRIPSINCIVKESLLRNPFTRGPILNAGYISNGNPEKMLDDCVKCLESGDSLIIFPEGTRSGSAKGYQFQRGAAHIALRAKTMVTPITIQCSPPTLSKAEKWYQIPLRRFHLAVEVEDDMVLDDFLTIAPKTIGVRRFNQYLQDYYNGKLDK